MPIYKRCKICNEEFAVTPALAEKREYCSVECRGASQQTLIEKECSVCGKSFKIKAYRKATATCSKECGYAAKKIKKSCVVCGKEFLVPKSREHSSKTCSNECGYAVRAKSISRQVEMDCANCGKLFTAPQSHINRRKYCSKECQHSSEKYLSGLSERSSGESNAMWKGGVAKQSDGYVYKHIANHPFVGTNNYILEHRLVIEEWMQQDDTEHDFMIRIYGKHYLRPEIQVHHIDEDKSNNERSNLIAVTVSAHRAIHSGNVPRTGTYWPETTEVFIKPC